MRGSKKSQLGKKASVVVAASAGITSGSSSTSSSLSNSKQELNHVNLVDFNNNEIVAANLGGGVGGGGEMMLAKSPIKFDESVHANDQENETKLVLFGLNSPVSQFSVQQKASSKSNDRFHQLFPSVPLDEYVIDS